MAVMKEVIVKISDFGYNIAKRLPKSKINSGTAV